MGYNKEFARGLRQLREKELMQCAVSWGVDFGETKWKREIRFSLHAKTGKLIANSFFTYGTP